MGQKRHKKFRQMLALMFAVIMVVTSVPQTAMPVFAEEADTSAETTMETLTVSENEAVTAEESTEPGSEPETESESESETEPETEPEAETEPETEPETESEPETETEPITESEPEAETEPVTESVQQQEGVNIVAEGESAEADSTSENDTEQEVYTFAFAPDEHAKVYNESGENEITELTVPIGSSDSFSFMLKVDEGYTIRRVMSDPKGVLTIKGDWTTGIYTISPPKKPGVYSDDATINIKTTEIADYTATFSYESDKVELTVLKGDEVAALTDNAITASNTESLSFKLKTDDAYTISGVTYTTGSGDTAYTEELTGYDDDGDGYLEYSLGRLFEDHVITITTGESCTVTFDTQDLTLEQVYYSEEDLGDGEIYQYFEWPGYTLSGDVKWAKGEALYFAVTSAPERATRFISTTGDDEGLIPIFAWTDEGYAVYKIEPAEDMTVTAKALPYRFPLEYDETMIEDIYISYTPDGENDYPVTLSEDKKSIEIYKDISFTLYAKPVEGKSIYSLYSTNIVYEDDGEGNYVESGSYKQRTETQINGEGYYYASFDTQYDMKNVGIEESCTITFDTQDLTLEQVYYSEEDLGDGESNQYFEWPGYTLSGDVKWAKGETLYFAVTSAPERATRFISTTGDDEGMLSPFVWTDEGYDVYEIKPTEDMTVTAKALPYRFPLEYDETMIEDIYISYTPDAESDYPVTLSEDKKSIEIYKDISFTLYAKPVEGKSIYSLYSTNIMYEDDGEGNYVESGSYKERAETQINEEGYYYASFYTQYDMKNVGIEEGCTITFNSPKAEVYNTVDEMPVESPVSWAVGAAFTFTVTPADRYKVLYVTTTGDESGKIDPVTEEIEGEVYSYYKVIPTADMTISVVTEASNRKITFVNECASMSYNITSAVLEDSGNPCFIDNSLESFTFNVTVNDESLVPNVMLKNNLGKYTVLKGTKSSGEGENSVYSYTINAADMTAEMTIYISDENAPKKLEVEYYVNSVDSVVVTVDGTEIVPVTSGVTTIVNTYTVPKGKTAVISAKSNERYRISYVDVDQGEELVTHDVGASEYSGEVKMDVNTRIYIGTKGRVYTTVKQIHADGTETEVEPISSRYCALPGDRYKVSLVCGETPVELTDVNVKSTSGTEAAICEDDPSSFLVTFGENATSITIRVSGTYVVNGKTNKYSGSVHFRVTKPIEYVKTTAPKKVVVDTNGRYTFTAYPAGASLANSGVELTLAEGVPEGSVTYKWSPGQTKSAKLTVCADTRAIKAGYGEVATVRLYRKGLSSNDLNYYIEGSEATVNIVEPTELLASTPEVTVAAAEDTSLTLKLDTPYGRSCVNGKQYYKIEVTPKAVEDQEIPASIAEATKAPFFVAREYPEYDDEGEEIPGFEQNAKIIVNNAGLGQGQKWPYDVKVTLVQTHDKTELTADNAAAQIAFSSKTAELSGVETKDPSFSQKVTVQKKASQIYTTQSNVIAANLKYESNTNIKSATAVDITDCDDTEKLSVKVENGKVIVSADASTKLGKHTIQVTPDGPETMYRQASTMTINVVKGIETLKISIPANSIYKQKNKAASLTASIVYNEGSTAPKTRKVTWEIVDESGMAFEESHEMYGKITVNNKGKVSVNKKVDVSENEQTFKIKVTAADFAGNTTTAMSEDIKITPESLKIGEIIIVQKNEETSNYTVVAQTGGVVPVLTTEQLKNAQLVALKENSELKGSYTESELEEVKIPASQLTVKSSAAKAIALTKDGEDIIITSGKPAKNIKLTVKTNDGGKKSAVMKVTVKYTEPEALGLNIYAGDKKLNDLNSDAAGSVSFNGTVNSKLTLRVMQKTGEDAPWDELYAYTNHTVSIKGGKILSSDAENGEYVVVVTKDKATVTLSDKLNKVKTKYTIENTAYSNKKAPKIAIKKETPKAPTSIVCGELAGRSLKYEIASSYDTAGKYILVEAEAVSASKKAANYDAFSVACDKVGKLTKLDSNTFKLDFAGSNIPLGNYKLTMTLGSMEGDTFIADVKPVTVTVKVVKAKVTKGSYKAKTTYKNVTAEAGTEIELSGTSKNLKSVSYNNLMGANVKGEENKFLEYFELDGNKLILKEELSAEQIAALKSSKTDNYGYVTYTAVYGDNGYGVPFTETKTVKITVKFKK